ncbi:uncharacterized protein [Phyllobates terribilis]|uniref:uncharacterized protein isoform X3 n=1 Tax=Phyllobates terribilis TaxID=111132 RepID=UPI003CCA871E
MSWVKAGSLPEKSSSMEELVKHLVQAQQSMQQQHLQAQQSMQQAQQSIQQQHQETTKLLLQQIQLQQKSQQQHQQEAQQQIQLLADAIQSRAAAPPPGPTDDSHVRKADELWSEEEVMAVWAELKRRGKTNDTNQRERHWQM